MIREYSRNESTTKHFEYPTTWELRQTNMTTERDKTTTETFAKQKTKPNKDSMMHIITYSD